MVRPPLLVHLGYQKTGSTFLQDRVFCQRDTGYWTLFPAKADRVRLNGMLVYPTAFAFDPTGLRTTANELMALCPDADLVPVISGESLVGSPVDMNAFSTRAIADRIHETFPECRILVVFREQASMLMSRYLYYIRGGGSRAVETFLRHPPKEDDDYGFWGGAPLPFFQYDGLVGYYQKLFGQDRVLALPFELLKRDAGDFVTRIGLFSGAKTDLSRVDLSPVKEAIPARTLVLRRIANILITREGDNPLSYLMPAPFYWRVARHPKLWIDRFARRFDDSAAKSRLKRRIEAFVGDYYRESNQRLATQTGFDLGALGYRL